MTSRTAQLGKLVPLFEAALQAKQAELSKIAMRIKELQSQLYALDHSKHVEHDSPAARAGADLRWETWVEHRKLLINKELIDAARQREEKRGQVAQALAKSEAVRKLHDQTSAEDRKVIERRTSW